LSNSHSTPLLRVGVLGLISSLAILGLEVGGAAAAPSVPTPASPGAIAPAGNVIVLLRDQHTDLTITRSTTSARVEANRRSQQPVLSRARSAGARQLRSFNAVNGFSANVSKAQAARLAADPAVAAVVPDLAITGGSTSPARAAAAAKAGSSTKPRTGICPSDPAKPLLEPEALQLTHTAYVDRSRAQAQNIADGSGVKVAFIADGLDVDNPDFVRADGSHVFVDYQDFSGDGVAAPTGGAEAFGDASSIAAQGRQTYDLADYVNPAHPLPAGCTIQVRGIAPGASLIGLKVFGNSNTAPTSRFIEAIDYAVEHGADVLNESFGGNPFPDTSDDPVTLADEAAIAAGVTVVSSTGDAGTTGTIGTPASSPTGVIGVAGTTSFRSYLQTGESGAQFSNGSWLSDNISALSSGGVTQAGGVPDLAAPGDLGWALCTPDVELYEECTDNAGKPARIEEFGGTSQSSPFVAGAAALVIQAYKSTHGGTRPSPALVKRLLTSTATDLGHPAYEQGAGLLDTLAAVKAAKGWHDAHGAPARAGSGLVVNKTQLRLNGRPGASLTARLAVTNTGKSVQLVKAATRSFEDVVRTTSGSAPIDTATAPSYVDSFGIARSYVSRTFTVGKVDRLDVSEATPSGAFATRIILIDPTGAYAAYSIPQGGGNYGHVDVRKPKAGTWTAYFALSKSSGFHGTVAYSVVQTDTSTHGTVSPRYRVLKPGQKGTFTVHTKLPTSPGDLSASVQLAGSSGTTTSVPMTLRAVVPPRNTTFVGTITGGNGRQAGGVAQSNVYRLDVPAGKRDLSIGVTFSEPDQTVFGFLTAPDGQVYSFQGNLADGHALQLYRRDPMKGRWTFSLEVTNPVSGLETSQSFVAHVAYNTVEVRAAVPTSRNTKLAAGVPVSVPVRIKNTGVAPITYIADARLKTSGTIPLVELSGHATSPLPMPAGVIPLWLVPTEVTHTEFTATGDQPVNLDVYFQSGNPERYSAASGNSATVDIDAAQVSPGLWAADVGQTGPFAGPAPAGTVTLSATSTGRLFDPAVTSDGGDPWQIGVGEETSTAADTAALADRVGVSRMKTAPVVLDSKRSSTTSSAAAVSEKPLTLRPGQSGTMMVTITPAGPHGSVVKGDLFVDSFDRDLAQGDELTNLPYTYTIR
jgi:hypothetical protein